jgi:hypothetical protein
MCMEILAIVCSAAGHKMCYPRDFRRGIYIFCAQYTLRRHFCNSVKTRKNSEKATGRRHTWNCCRLTQRKWNHILPLHCKCGTGTKSHVTHVAQNMLHNYPLLASLEAYLAHHVSKKGWGIFEHVKQNMLHMLLIVLHLRQLCHIVCHIWLCAGTDLQCAVKTGTLWSFCCAQNPGLLYRKIQYTQKKTIADFGCDQEKFYG